jgi:hypothetical protein
LHFRRSRRNASWDLRRLLSSHGTTGTPRPSSPVTAQGGAEDTQRTDTNLVQGLGEAHAKEAELEADLTAHIADAQEELREEQVEIAIYTRIEAFAEAVGDRETAQLAKRVRRDEERMPR